MDIIICLRWIGRYLEGEHYGGIRDRRIFGRDKKRIWGGEMKS